MTKRVAIIGGGPIGVEAALYGACAGFDVHLYERGQIAENVRLWGHIRAFTDWSCNRSPLACKLLHQAGVSLPPDETTPTGQELVSYILHLAALKPLRGRLHLHSEVIGLTRERCLKSDFVDRPCRAGFSFRLLLRQGTGHEEVQHVDAVIDAGGVYATPSRLGGGAATCLGEQTCQDRIAYHLPDVAGRDRRRFANRHTLIVGSGYSAASTLLSICDLGTDFPRTRVTWAMRGDVPCGRPFTLIPDDPLPHRAEMLRRANAIIERPNVDFRPRTIVDVVAPKGKGCRVTLSCDAACKRTNNRSMVCAGTDGLAAAVSSVVTDVIECDIIVAHTGFQPDRSLWSELQVREHPATGGPCYLADELLAHNARRGTGLSIGYTGKRLPQDQAALDRWYMALNNPALLRTGEPNFFIIGIKSYGRDSNFLMVNGFRQVRDVYKLISGEGTLDLYGGVLS